MTDRHIAYTVVLEEPIREDDAQRVIDAIKMVRGVADVVPVVRDAKTYWARDRARADILQQLLKVVRETNPDDGLA